MNFYLGTLIKRISWSGFSNNVTYVKLPIKEYTHATFHGFNFKNVVRNEHVKMTKSIFFPRSSDVAVICGWHSCNQVTIVYPTMTCFKQLVYILSVIWFFVYTIKGMYSLPSNVSYHMISGRIRATELHGNRTPDYRVISMLLHQKQSPVTRYRRNNAASVLLCLLRISVKRIHFVTFVTIFYWDFK